MNIDDKIMEIWRKVKQNKIGKIEFEIEIKKLINEKRKLDRGKLISCIEEWDNRNLPYRYLTTQKGISLADAIIEGDVWEEEII